MACDTKSIQGAFVWPRRSNMLRSFRISWRWSTDLRWHRWRHSQRRGRSWHGTGLQRRDASGLLRLESSTDTKPRIPLDP
jgi:hypothetical protein